VRSPQRLGGLEQKILVRIVAIVSAVTLSDGQNSRSAVKPLGAEVKMYQYTILGTSGHADGYV